jgi:hypothetical protein
MTADAPAPYEGQRGAAALILAVAEKRDADAAVILGCQPTSDRRARIAYALANWLVASLRDLGASPEDFARAVIELTREDEAQQ